MHGLESKERFLVSVIIPAYNEAERLPSTLQDLNDFFRMRGYSWQIIVVDDGSEDNTSKIVESLSRSFATLTLIRLEENRGKGYAVRHGVGAADGKYIIFMDADGSTPIEEIDRLKASIDDGIDIAIGSRAMKSKYTKVKALWHRKLLGRIYNSIVNLLILPGIEDTQCGFKMFKVQVAKDLFSRVTADRFSFDVELLFLARRLGYSIAEIPVNWTNVPGSKVHLVRDSLRMLWDILRFRWQAIMGVYGGDRRA